MLPSLDQTTSCCQRINPPQSHSQGSSASSQSYLSSPQSCPSQLSAQLWPKQSTELFQPYSSALSHRTHYSQQHAFCVSDASSRHCSSHSRHPCFADEYPQSQCQPPVAGLSLLVKQCFGKPLNKSSQFSDWEKRPLSNDQVHYAGKRTDCAL